MEQKANQLKEKTGSSDPESTGFEDTARQNHVLRGEARQKWESQRGRCGPFPWLLRST